MSTPSPTELLAFLQEHRFLSPSQVQQFSGDSVKTYADSQSLARELIDQKLLTAYQANQLLQGKGSNLLLGPYLLVERLGAGGMGQVFKARHIKMDREVALKIIPKEMVSNSTAVSRFYQEARAVAKLSHPNIVTAFDINEVEQTHYLAMELVDGIDLARLVQQSGRLEIPQACEYIRQAAIGLQHAYEMGLVHRDIKPGNLMVARPRSGNTPVIKILDFGLARFESDGERATRLTQFGHVIGTVDYMAPEQSKDSRIVDIRADIYSLGCSLFYLLTGNPPFPGNSAAERLSARVLGNMPSVRKSRREVPALLDRVLAKMTARNPLERYQTPGGVAKSLAQFVKPGSKLDAKAVSTPADSVSSPARGTKIHAETNEIKEVLPEVPGKTSSKPEPAKEEGASPFAELTDTGTPSKKAQRARWRAESSLPSWLKRPRVVAAALAASLALILLAVILMNRRPPVPSPSHVDAFMGGEWRIEDDELVQAAPVQASLIFGDFNWTDYEFSVQVMLPEDVDRGAIHQLYRVTSRGLSHFGIASSGLQDVHDIAQSVEMGCFGPLYQRPGKLKKKHWHEMRVRVRGSEHRCFIDEEPEFVYYDQKNSRGAVGLYTERTPARFKDIVVNDLKGKVLFKGLPRLPDNPGMESTEPISQNQVHCLKGHNAAVVSLSFSRGGRRLLSSSDGEYRRWEDFGKYKPVGSHGCTIRLWDVESGKELDRCPPIEPPQENTASLVFSIPIQNSFLSAVNLSPLAVNQSLGTSCFAYEAPVDTKEHLRQVRLWEIRDDKLTPSRTFAARIPDLTFLGITADRLGIRALNSHGGIWEGDEIRELEPKQKGTIKDGTWAALAPNGLAALVARREEPFAEIDLVQDIETGRWKEKAGNILTLAFSPDSSKILTGGDDGKVRLWDVASAKQLHCFSAHERRVRAVAFSPNGKRALSGSDDMTVRLWDLDGEEQLSCFTGHGGAVQAVAFSPDGRLAASCGDDYTVRLWRLEEPLPPPKEKIPKKANPKPEANPSIDDLRKDLKDKDPYLREKAAAQLAKHGSGAKSAIEDLAEIMNADLMNPTNVRRIAALALGSIGADAVDVLIEALQGRQLRQTRQFAAEALQQMKYPANEKAIPAILESIEKDKDPDVRVKCVCALFGMEADKLRDSAVEKVLTKVLDERGEDTKSSRYNAAYKLAHVLNDKAPDKVVDVLLELLTAKGFKTYEGVKAQVENDDTETTSCNASVNVRETFGDDARYLAAQALSWMGEKAAKRRDVRDALRKAAESDDPKLKDAANEAMRKLKIKD